MWRVIRPFMTRTSTTAPRKASNQESKMSAWSGASAVPVGGGMRATTVSSTDSTPIPLLALISKASAAGIASTFSICAFTSSVARPGGQSC